MLEVIAFVTLVLAGAWASQWPLGGRDNAIITAADHVQYPTVSVYM